MSRDEDSREQRANSGGAIETLAMQILGLDQRIVNCYVVRIPDGQVLADVVKQEFRGRVKLFSQTGSGMGPATGLTMVNILRRLDTERSKLNYVMVSREKYDGVFFPAICRGKDLVIGLLMEKGGDSEKIYETVMKLL